MIKAIEILGHAPTMKTLNVVEGPKSLNRIEIEDYAVLSWARTLGRVYEAEQMGVPSLLETAVFEFLCYSRICGIECGIVPHPTLTDILIAFAVNNGIRYTWNIRCGWSEECRWTKAP